MSHQALDAEPAGHFITFRTYGTWLPGDPRGSVDRQHNTPGEPNLPHFPSLHEWSKAALIQPPMVFSDDQREVCDRAIQDISARREWRLLALNVRTNHVHVVLWAAGSADRIMNDLKSFSTRALRKGGLIGGDRMVWARHGSTRRLVNRESIERACLYVVEAQGRRVGTIGDGW